MSSDFLVKYILENYRDILKYNEFPGFLVVSTWCFNCTVAHVQSLAGELGSFKF